MENPPDHYAAYAGRRFQVAALLLAGCFFAAFTVILRGNVPSDDPVNQWFFGAFTATCLTGVFYIATHMFWVVLREDRESRRRRPRH